MGIILDTVIDFGDPIWISQSDATPKYTFMKIELYYTGRSFEQRTLMGKMIQCDRVQPNLLTIRA